MNAPVANGARSGSRIALGYVTLLFFAWGFATSLIDPLIAAVRRVFDLSFTEALLTASAWFIAYALASIPAAFVLGRLGYSRSIIAALGVMVGGCLIVPLATMADWYPGILAALFVIACGVTLLQVAANPLVAALGPAKSAHTRLNFTQAFNSLGTFLGPRIGSSVLLTGGIFAAGAVVTASTRDSSLRAIDLAFLGMGGAFALLALLVFTARKRINASAPAASTGSSSPVAAFRSPWALFGAAAIFLYVGAEVTIGGILTDFLHSPDTLDISVMQAGIMVSYYWGGAMVGRFIGSALLTRIPAGVLLAACTLAAALLCAVVTQTIGFTAGYAAIAIGLFNSIMFPTIFTLTLERSSAPPAATSGLLCMAIVGGAVLPLLAGRIADGAGGVLNPAFYVPLCAYLGITVFALLCGKIPKKDDVNVVVSPH